VSGKAVDPGTIGVWRWRGLVWLVVVLAGWPLVIHTTPLQGLPVRTGFWWASGGVIGAIGSMWVFIWPRAIYRHLRYQIDATGIVVRSGVLWRSEAALPRVRIQHTDVTQGPLQRRYGVATLKLYTAGSRFTEIQLPGLAHSDALALRDSLIADFNADVG
jgi:uncharacterized protein